MKYTKASIGLMIFSAQVSAANHEDVEAMIAAQFPNSKIVSKQDCELGKAKTKAVGLVLQKDLKLHQSGANPLEAVILQMTKGTFTVLSKKIQNSKGMDSDFLRDFWSGQTRTAKVSDIRCVVPNKDSDITTAANGEYQPSFKGKEMGQHLCFAASDVYNNWACFNFDDEGKIQSSFVQMNAD